MIRWHIGCSGFHYKDWRGIFYPEKLAMKNWFEYYCRRFATLELNVTFYRFPQVSFLRNWYEQAPPDFRFSVKVPKAITHFKQFHDTARMLGDFYGTINEGLREKLGPVLFQMPPRFTYNPQKLERIISAVNPSFTNVTEFRHVSWWRPDVYEALAARGISFCGMSHPTLPDELIANTSTVYYRFHGVPNLYRSAYSQQFLQHIVSQVRQSTKVTEGWFYFNNDYDAVAVADAIALLAAAGMAIPPADTK